MSEPDRIAVPTNGHRPHGVATLVPTTERATGATAGPSTGPSATTDATAPTDAELAAAVSPKQVAVGFAVVASIVLVAARILARRARG